jgi:CRP/FNR family cyclic AMP-dependent transcriptional regulator
VKGAARCQLVAGECRTCPARAGRLFCDLPDGALAAFDRVARGMAFAQNATLFMEGDEAQGVFVVCSGRVKLVATSSEGKTIITQLVGPGEALGLTAVVSGRPLLVTARALESCTVKFVPADEFRVFLRDNGDACLRVAQHIGNSYHQAHQLVRSIGLATSVSEKLAKLLYDMCEREGVRDDGARIRFALTHEEVAQMIGTTRETVTRTFSDLRREGIVDKRGADLVVRDRRRLAALAHVG